jgi:large subunit ribosomal protein L29
MAKATDLRDLSIEDLELRYSDLSKELFGLRNEMKVSKKLEKPHLIRMKKKERARVMTVLRERELGVGV